MEPKLIVAYTLLLALACFAAAVIGHAIYHAQERSYHRRLRREAKVHARATIPAGKHTG